MYGVAGCRKMRVMVIVATHAVSTHTNSGIGFYPTGVAVQRVGDYRIAAGELLLPVGLDKAIAVHQEDKLIEAIDRC